MRAPENLEQAQRIATKIGLSVEDVAGAYGIPASAEEEQLRQRLASITDVDTLWQMINTFPSGTMQEAMILERVIEVSDNRADLKDAFDVLPDESEARKKAVRKMVKLAKGK